MARARPPKKPSPNGENLPKRVQNLEIENASMKAEKVGWWRGGLVVAGVTVTLFSSIVGVALYLDAKIERVETRLMAEISEVRTIAVRTEAKVDNLQKGFEEMRKTLTEFLLRADQNQNADPEERNANLNGEGSDTPSDPLGESPLGDSPIDASTDAPIASPTTPTTTQDNLPL